MKISLILTLMLVSFASAAADICERSLVYHAMEDVLEVRYSERSPEDFKEDPVVAEFLGPNPMTKSCGELLKEGAASINLDGRAIPVNHVINEKDFCTEKDSEKLVRTFLEKNNAKDLEIAVKSMSLRSIDVKTSFTDEFGNPQKWMIQVRRDICAVHDLIWD